RGQDQRGWQESHNHFGEARLMIQHIVVPRSSNGTSWPFIRANLGVVHLRLLRSGAAGSCGGPVWSACLENGERWFLVPPETNRTSDRSVFRLIPGRRCAGVAEAFRG